MKVRQVGSRPRARHSRGGSRRLAVVAAVGGVLAVVIVAVVLTRLLQDRSAGSHSGAAVSSPRDGAVTRSPSSSPRPSATPSAATPGDPLGPAAQAFLSTRSGTVLAGVYDARTGQTWTIGRSKPQAEASIVKLDILETLLAQHRADGTALSATEKSLAQAMIEDSDNDATTRLWDTVGGAQGIGSYNASIGLAGTTPSSCVECPGFPWPGWGLTTTTPADQLSLLRELLQSSAQLTDAQREYALGLMDNVTESQRWGVSGGVPPQARVALKNGWLPLTSADDDWQINSIGWISGDGRSYLMAVLSTGNPSEQYGIDTINGLAEMVWRGLR